MDLVSVIVPIYNVQQFLNDCLNSISKQSYNNIEVLLIDDGSTDLSGKIASDFSRNDKRFFYYKKSNGGLSSARNYGIELAKGDWLVFIDSDDLVSPHFIEKLLNLVNKTKTDIGICNYSRFSTHPSFPDEDDSAVREYSVIDKFSIYESIDTPLMMVAWNKIYRRSLFENIRYPSGMIHEDVGTTYLLLDLVDSFSLLDEKLYLYRINEESISKSKISMNKIDLIYMYYDQMLFFQKKFHSDKRYKQFYRQSSLRLFKVFGTLLSYNKSRYIDYHSFKNGVDETYKKMFNQIIKSYIGFSRRVLMVLSFKKVFLIMLFSKIKCKIRR